MKALGAYVTIELVNSFVSQRIKVSMVPLKAVYECYSVEKSKLVCQLSESKLKLVRTGNPGCRRTSSSSRLK